MVLMLIPSIWRASRDPRVSTRLPQAQTSPPYPPPPSASSLSLHVIPVVPIALHFHNLGLLCGDDALGQRLDLRVLSLRQRLLGHADRGLVMRDHHLKEHAIEIDIPTHHLFHLVAVHHATRHHPAVRHAGHGAGTAGAVPVVAPLLHLRNLALLRG